MVPRSDCDKALKELAEMMFNQDFQHYNKMKELHIVLLEHMALCRPFGVPVPNHLGEILQR